FEKQIRLDDNFSIPLCVGLVLFAATFLPCMQTPESKMEKAAEEVSSTAEQILDNLSNSIK
ncbi:MAG: hypothetical protein IKB74_00450, partial [Lentisphaeria bacterium]|nr:hypothetical protein [Lentisphaeria bacterium]